MWEAPASFCYGLLCLRLEEAEEGVDLDLEGILIGRIELELARAPGLARKGDACLALLHDLNADEAKETVAFLPAITTESRPWPGSGRESQSTRFLMWPG